jgi:hypothetical protein
MIASLANCARLIDIMRRRPRPCGPN